MENTENKTTTDNNFSLSHPTIPIDTHTNPYLDLILKEVIYTIEIHKELESNKYDTAKRMFNSIFKADSKKYTKKKLRKIGLFMGCLVDLIVNKPEIIGYIVGEMCKNKITENKENNGLYDVWVHLRFALKQSIRPYVKLFDPQSTQVTFLTESCYELSKKSIYDLENVITKFILGKEEERGMGKEYTLNDLRPTYTDGIREFLGIYIYPLDGILNEIVKEYWIYKLLKINEKTNILEVTPEIAKFTEEFLQFCKNFYKKINKEFEDFECKGVSEKNNIVPFIYYYLSMKIIHLLSYMIEKIYFSLFDFCHFKNWDTFAKFFVYPLYEIFDNFCEKLIIDENNNKFKLYKYFSNCNNEILIGSIGRCAELSHSPVYSRSDRIYTFGLKEKEDGEWVYVKNKLLVENKNILEKWIDYFKKFQ